MSLFKTSSISSFGAPIGFLGEGLGLEGGRTVLGGLLIPGGDAGGNPLGDVDEELVSEEPFLNLSIKGFNLSLKMIPKTTNTVHINKTQIHHVLPPVAGLSGVPATQQIFPESQLEDKVVSSFSSS